jgi:hypothetical protein
VAEAAAPGFLNIFNPPFPPRVIKVRDPTTLMPASMEISMGRLLGFVDVMDVEAEVAAKVEVGFM